MPMKEQVADISKVLQDITAEMRLMRETIDQQYAEIAKLNRNIEALNRQIRKKDETIAKRNAQPAIEKIKEYIMSSSVVGFDESGCYCNKRLDWAWIAQTVYYTLLFRADGRSSKVLADKFGDSLERMTAVTDRHSAYFALHFLNHQVCLAHLLRELQYLSELNDKQGWSDKIASLFREAIHERNSNPSAIIPKASWLERLDNLLKLNISSFGKKFETFKKGLIKCRDYIFNFLKDPMIPSDNNGSERGIRKLKIKLKNSCTFRSDLGTDAFL